MRIYTRTGDAGQTALPDGMRVSKSDSLVMAYGAVDEASAAIGVAISHGVSKRLAEMLTIMQADLLTVGADLADEKGGGKVFVSGAMVSRLEEFIDEIDGELEPLSNFVLPGGSVAAAHLHLARTVMRRAETLTVGLVHKGARKECLAYINRASDLLFVMARAANAADGCAERTWSAKDTL